MIPAGAFSSDLHLVRGFPRLRQLQHPAVRSPVQEPAAGVAPADNPQYAVVVTAGIPDSVYSGLIAPVWRDVMAQTLTTFRVPPSTSPAPDLPVYW